MKEFETITVTNGDGKDIEYQLVTIIENEKTNMKYVVYKDLIDDEESEDIDLYISKVVFEDGKEIIEDIEDEKEWNQVAKVLDDLFREQEENNR
jgi:uncharacterized protein YrzB (UPF0473 family)